MASSPPTVSKSAGNIVSPVLPLSMNDSFVTLELKDRSISFLQVGSPLIVVL